MTSRQVISTYLALAGLCSLSASMTWAIHTLFLLEAGLDILHVFLVHATYTAAIAVLEIPTGAVADTIGRRRSFLLSLLTLTLAALGFVAVARAGGGAAMFALPALLLGLGGTLYSGSVEAWMVDALRHTGFQERLDRVFARAQVITGGATLVGTAAGGLLGSLDLALPFLARAAVLVATFGLAVSRMTEVGFTPARPGRGEWVASFSRVTAAGLRYAWRHPTLPWMLVLAAVQYGFLTWAFHAWQPHFLALLGRHEIWIIGAVSTAIALATMAGSALVPRLIGPCRRRTTVLLWAAALQTAAAIGIGIAGSFALAAAMILVFALSTGVTGPVRQAYLHDAVPSDRRATLISCDSLAGNSGGVFNQTALGAAGRSLGVGAAYLIGGLITGLALPMLWRVRRIGGDADRLVGGPPIGASEPLRPAGGGR